MYKTKMFTFIIICLLSLVGSITLMTNAQAMTSGLPDAVLAFTPLAHITNSAVIEETPYSYITSAALTPAVGKSTTSFTWSVRYYSSISAAPMNANIVIDDIPHAMNLASGQVYNGIYSLSQYLTDTGMHVYRFAFTDSLGNNRLLPVSGNYSGPQVYTDAQLTNPVLAPVYGIPSTSFSWQIQYNDPNGFAPAQNNIIIDSNNYAMSLLSGSASNGTYGFTTVYTQGGVHNYRFSFKDSINSGILLPVSGTYSGPTVNTTPALSGGFVAPGMGSPTTQFTFVVNYQDPDNHYAASPQLFIDGAPASMSLFNGSATNATYVLYTTLSSGFHAYYYQFTDPYGASARFPASGTLSGPTVNYSPVLSNALISPTYGIPSSSFTWSVNYIDADGNAPASTQVYVDGTAYDLSLASGVAANGTYQVTRPIITAGVHQYYFVSSDGLGSPVRYPVSGTFSGPTVNTDPTLSNGYVSPGYGTPSSSFNFVVSYQDIDNHYAGNVQLIMDGNTVPMSLFNGAATNATYVVTTGLSVGIHAYYFQCTDPYGATARFPAAGTLSGPTINNTPVLSNSLISPTYGIPSSSFSWSVNYTDVDGNAPTMNKVYIDGTGYDMTLASGSNANGTYQLSQNLITAGIHQYYYVFSDGLSPSVRYPVSGTFSGPTVNTAPGLSNGYVVPVYADTTSKLTFLVTYQDVDYQYASTARIYIDGVPSSMSLFYGLPNLSTYVYYTTLPAGIHAYYFQFADPYGAETRYPASGTLSGPSTYQLNPPGGLTATLSSLSVVNLSWQDNSIQETGTRIEYRIDTSSWQTLATVNAEVTTYTYTLAPYKTYSYRAYAMANSARSANSNEVTINPGLWVNTMGDFDIATDTVNLALQLLEGVPSYPAISWLSSYSAHSGIMRLNFSNLSQGVKLTGIGRLRADSPANPWHRIRVTYYTDADIKGLEVLPSILFYDSYTSYGIREIGAVWSGVGLQSTRNWYTLEGYVYSHSTSGLLQITFKNTGTPGSIYVDTIEWDYAVPPALQNPLKVTVAKGDFDVAADSSGWAYQRMAECSPTLPAVGWTSSLSNQTGVLSLTYSQITQGVKITMIDLLSAPQGKNVAMSFKVYLANASPTAMHINAYLMGEQSLALSQFDFAGYAEMGILPGNAWSTLYLPLTSSSLQTSYRIQFQIKDNFSAPITLYMDDVQFMYDQGSVQTPLELVEQVDTATPFKYIS